MINILPKKGKLKDRRYTHNYYKDNDLLISKKVSYTENKGYRNDEPILISLTNLYNEPLNSLNDAFHIFADEPIENSLFTISGLGFTQSTISLEISSYDCDDAWKTSVYNPKMVLKRMLSLICSEFKVKEIEESNYLLDILYTQPIDNFDRIGDFIIPFKECIVQLQKTVEMEFSGFRWIDDYQRDEPLFSKEVISKLLRAMDFKKICYNHGRREYGRDFIFSETDKFDNFKHYDMQVKAGNIRGGNLGQIDELIGQLDDAFSMPFVRENEPPAFISTFIIAISGYFTENAKEKIRLKIPRGLLGSVHILDRDQICALFAKYG